MRQINLLFFTLWCLSCADNQVSERPGANDAGENDSESPAQSDDTGSATTGEEGSGSEQGSGVDDSDSVLGSEGEEHTGIGDATDSDSSESVERQTDEDSDFSGERVTDSEGDTDSISDTDGSIDSEGEAPSESDTASAPDSDTPSSDGGIYMGGCPDELPARGSVCSVPDLTCTYGDSPVVSCRHEARCFEGEWYISSASCASGSCPEGISAGDDCDTPDSHCLVETGTECVCSALLGNRWGCEPAPTPAAGCPAFPPYQGTACPADPPSECVYERCLLADEIATFHCAGGMWTGTLESCGDHNR